MSEVTEEPKIEDQNLIKDTPLMAFVSRTTSLIQTATGASVVDREYADNSIYIPDVKSIYEAHEVEQLKNNGVKYPAFVSGVLKQYAEESMTKNITVTIPFNQTPNKLFVITGETCPIMFGFVGTTIVYETSCPKVNNGSGYLVINIMPVTKYEKVNQVNLFMRTVEASRALLSQSFETGEYIVAVHGFYASNESEFNTGVSQTVNYCLNAPNDAYGVHACAVDMGSVNKFVSPEVTVNDIFSKSLLPKNNVDKLIDIINTQSVKDNDLKILQKAFADVSEKFVYKALECETYKSPASNVTTLLVNHTKT